MVRFIIFASLVAVAVTIYTLIDCGRTERHRVRSLPKTAWMLVILLLPLVGAGLWYVLGRPNNALASGPEPRSKAPDDDEDFLRQLEVWRRQQQRETELNQREAELKRQEAEKKKKKDSGDSSSDESSDNTSDPNPKDS